MYAKARSKHYMTENMSYKNVKGTIFCLFFLVYD